MARRAVVIAVLALVAANLPAAGDETTSASLSRAQSLAWAKKFDEAAAIYLRVLRNEPGSRDANVGLGRVRLWQGRYSEARTLFRRVLAARSSDADAAEGAAQAAYWSGDFRTAEREYRALVAAHPERQDARRSLAELRTASATTERFDASVVDDDQPFRGSRSEARVSIFSDPLTRWDVAAGAYTVNSDISGRHAVPFVRGQNETVIPSLRLTVSAALGAIRTPDNKTRAIGGAAGRVRLPREHSLSMSFTRRELLATATRLYPFVDVIALRWDHAKPWLASIGVERDRFSDRNAAKAADAYAIFPIWKSNRWTLWSGASALARDTRDSRFYVNGISAVRDASGSFFHYTYRGGYDPYWTPHDLVEGRLILAIERQIGSGTTVRLQGDGGRARDRAVGFFPESGRDPFPADIGSATFHRTFSPWRVRLSSSAAVARGLTLDISFEHAVTAFYRANTIHAALARRR